MVGVGAGDACPDIAITPSADNIDAVNAAIFCLVNAERAAQNLAPLAQSDAQLLLDRDGGLDAPRGQAARVCLYLFERDAAVGLLRSG